jgi:hypothetical protein
MMAINFSEETVAEFSRKLFDSTAINILLTTLKRILFEKLTFIQIVVKFQAFCGA